MKKIFFIPVIALIACSLTGCGESDSSLSLDYVPVKTSKDAKWSFIGPDGKMLYEDEFEKKPSPVINGFFNVEESEGISVYKASNKKPELVPGCEDLVYAGCMSEGLIPVTRKNERIKLVDASGEDKLTFMPVNDTEIISVSSIVTEGILCFGTADNKHGLISKSGKVLIPAKYDMLIYASEGMVVANIVGAPDSTGYKKSDYYLLDKNGKEITHFKDNMSLQSRFIDGKALVMKGDERIPGYINKKGEFTKLPGKVQYFGSFFNGKEFAFVTEDNKTGLMNIEGEILIRPKYDHLSYYSKNKFYVKDGDSKWSILNATGEKEKTYDDFESFYSVSQAYPNTKFEVIAGEKDHQFDFYKFDGKAITQESFYDINLAISESIIYTDYFNAEEVGKKMASLIDDNGVKGAAFGTDISKLLPENSTPKTYSNTYSIELPDIHGGYKWTLKVTADASMPISSPIYTTKIEKYWLSTYSRNVISGYQFNQATVSGFSIIAQSHKDFLEGASQAIIDALIQRGFKQANMDNYEGDSITVLTKGDMTVDMNYYSDGENTLTLNIYRSTKTATATVDEIATNGTDTAQTDSIAH